MASVNGSRTPAEMLRIPQAVPDFRQMSQIPDRRSHHKNGCVKKGLLSVACQPQHGSPSPGVWQGQFTPSVPFLGQKAWPIRMCLVSSDLCPRRPSMVSACIHPFLHLEPCMELRDDTIVVNQQDPHNCFVSQSVLVE